MWCNEHVFYEILQPSILTWKASHPIWHKKIWSGQYLKYLQTTYSPRRIILLSLCFCQQLRSRPVTCARLGLGWPTEYDQRFVACISYISGSDSAMSRVCLCSKRIDHTCMRILDFLCADVKIAKLETETVRNWYFAKLLTYWLGRVITFNCKMLCYR